MTAFLRSLDDVLGLKDSPTRKTSSGTGTESVQLSDAAAALVVKATFDNNLGLTDTVSVAKILNPTDSLGLHDAGSTYIKGYVGTDSTGLTDEAPILVTTSAQAWTRTVTDNLGLQDLDRPQAQGWLSTIEDALNLKDTRTPVYTQGVNNLTQGLEEAAGLDDDTTIYRGLVLTDAAGLTDEAPIILQTANTFFAVTIPDTLGLIDNDGTGDTTGFLFVTRVLGVNPNQQIEDVAALRDSLDITLTATDFIFQGPIVEDGPPGADDLSSWYDLNVGVTVIQDPDTTWRTVRFPTSEELAAALTVYRGGYNYQLTADQAAVVTAAGFGAYLVTSHPPITQHIGETPVVTGGGTGYGSGPYGGGSYGGM